MTTNVVQIRMPSLLLKNINDLVKKGFYKNKSEAIIDAVRHFVGFTCLSAISVTMFNP
jgi:Arc/MetJ-type ribon-helix-helix transcriptional regulator